MEQCCLLTSGDDCTMAPGVCTLIQPCRNGGACLGNGGEEYKCLCPLGFAGQHCEKGAYFKMFFSYR